MNLKLRLERNWGQSGMSYKDTPFGKIPENWGVVPISEVTEFVTDYVANGSFASLAENVTYKDTEDAAVLIRLVDYNNDFKGNFVFIDEHAYEFLGKSKLYGDEIIISNVGANVGTVFRCPHLPYKMSLAPNAIMVKFKASDDFYYFWLRSHAGQHSLHSIVTGSAQPKFNKTNFRDMLVPVPPRDQMDKIVSILQPLEAKIEHNKKINDNLLQQALALYQEMFINKQTPYRKICRADEYFDISIGKTPPRKESQWFTTNSSDITWVSISDMGSCGTYIKSSSEQLTPDAVKKFNIKVVPSNTVILSFKLTVGRIAITHGEMTTNEAIAHFKTDKTYINEYLYCYLKNFNYQTMGSTSSIATAVNSKIIKAMPFVIPEAQEISHFHSTVGPMFEQMLNNQLENELLTKTRDTLLPKLMSGELDISEIDL